MAIVVNKGLIGKEDIRFYSAASPTYSRTTSTGGATTLHSMAATYVPVVQGAASNYWTQNTVQRATTEVISRYFGIAHSTATYTGQNPANVGEHVSVFGFRNGAAATSIQAAASNAFLRDGVARIVIPKGTFTASTSILLPRKCFIFGNGRGTIIRASSTNQTSCVFRIAGTAGATNSNLSANATIGTQTVSVSNGALFHVDDWIEVQDSKNKELQQIKSIAANDLTVRGVLRHTYRSAATTKKATLIYPAEVVIDNLDIALSSATQGSGISATYMVRSHIGPDVQIRGFARAGFLGSQVEDSNIEPQIVNPSSTAAGKGYGVRLTNWSADNLIGGLRDGTTKEVSDGGALRNMVWGTVFRGTYSMSGMHDPIAVWYRMRKPQLSYAAYGATTVVTCPASTNAPSEVWIDGHVYRNLGTVLCDLSRTKTPSQATVGGLDRGPATATRAYYIYAAPSQNPSATRQFDLFASSQSPATGPLASATWPAWSFVAPVITGATVRVIPFRQVGDRFYNFQFRRYISKTSVVAHQGTWKQVRQNDIPVGSRAIALQGFMRQNSFGVQLETIYSVSFTDGSQTNTSNSMLDMYLDGYRTGGLGANAKSAGNVSGWVPVDSNRYFSFSDNFPAGGGTCDWFADYKGYEVARADYK